MAIVQSFGALQSTRTRETALSSGGGSGSINLYGYAQTYGEIYRRQPSVRTCVDFIARNVAQLGLHTFRRVSDTDRERLPDHQLAQWITRPNPATTRYRLIESLLQDLGIYFSAYWLKVGDPVIGLVRLPPEQMSVSGELMPTSFTWTRENGEKREFAADRIVFFSGYDPSRLMGLSPLETLRRVLAEEYASGVYRQEFWNNAGRQEGIIERPKEAGTWQKDKVQEFIDMWRARTRDAGSTVVLQDGMTYKQTSFSAKDSEYISARKLTREEVAAQYHIPLPMVGILDHATFSNIKEQHKQLYQDCLGPWLVMVEEEIERQLLPECDDQDNIYLEFNIAEKMKGSFEEQATSLRELVGRPIMTANEGRARLNLPRIADDPSADELAEQQGGPANSFEPSRTGSSDDDVDMAAAAPMIVATQKRINARLAKLEPADRVSSFDRERWTRELAHDLAGVLGEERGLQIAAHVIKSEQRRLEASNA